MLVKKANELNFKASYSNWTYIRFLRDSLDPSIAKFNGFDIEGGSNQSGDYRVSYDEFQSKFISTIT